MHQIRKRLTYANVMSSIAVFLLLGGAAAFAATKLPKNSVGTKQLKKNAVNSAKVKDHSLTAADLSAGTVPDAYTKGESDSRYTSSGSAYTKGESNGRYLRGTVTVVAEIGAIPAGSFDGEIVSCPAGYQAIGGGVSPENVLQGKVSESAPTYNGEDSFFQTVGQHGPVDGWIGEISTQGSAAGLTAGSKVIVICSPIG